MHPSVFPDCKFHEGSRESVLVNIKASDPSSVSDMRVYQGKIHQLGRVLCNEFKVLISIGVAMVSVFPLKFVLSA